MNEQKGQSEEALKGLTERTHVPVGLWHHVPVQGLLRVRFHHSPERNAGKWPPVSSGQVQALGSGWGAGRGRRFELFQPRGPGCYHSRAPVFSWLRRH